MRYLSKAKEKTETWLNSLDKLNLFKLVIAFSASILYLLSGMVPALGQFLLCGAAITVSFISFSSILLSLSGVSINKLKPIEELFDKLHKNWEGKEDD